MKAIQQYIILGIAITLLSIAFFWDNANQRNEDLSSYVNRIENYIQNNEQAVYQVFEDRELLQRLLNNEYGEKDWQTLEKFKKEPYSIFIYKESELLFWSTNKVKPVDAEVSPVDERRSRLVKFNDSWYEIIKETIEIEKGIYTLVGLIPIYYQYDIENEHIEDHFALKYPIPKPIRLTEKETDFPVKNGNGVVLAHLESQDSFTSYNTSLFLMLLYGLGFIFLGAFINRVSNQLTEERSPVIGFSFLALSVFVIRGITIAQPYSTIFGSIELFKTQEFIAPIVSGSVMGLFINSILILWIITFFFRKVPLKTPTDYPLQMQRGIVAGSYFMVFLSFLWLNNIVRDLIIKSKVALEFDNIFQLDTYSFLGFIAVSLLIMGLFLFSHKMVSNAVKAEISHQIKLRIAVAFGGVIFLLTLLGLLNWNVFFLTLFVIAYIVLFEQFVIQKTASLQWMGIWLLAYSILVAALIIHFNQLEEQLNRIDFAERLVTKRDIEAEKQFTTIEKEILTEEVVLNIANPVIPRSVIEEAIKDVNKKNSYLLENYELNLHFFSRSGRGRKGEKADYGELIEKIEAGDSTLSPDLYFWSNEKNEEYAYLAQLKIMEGSRNLGSIILQYIPKNVESINAYPELLTDRSLSRSRRVDYDFAIYKDGIRYKGDGDRYEDNLEFTPPNEEKTYHFSDKDGRSYLVYKADKEQIVIVGADKAPVLRPFQLLSYVFCFLSILMLLILLVNRVTNITPTALASSFALQPSLRNRIQYSVIAVIVLTIVTIGTVTYFYFRADSDEYHSSRLSRKARGVIGSTDYWMKVNKEDSSYILDIEELSKIHRLDVNLFDTDGNLMISSQPEIFNKGLVARQIAPKAYFSMTQKNLVAFTEREQIGDLEYNVAYRAVKNHDKKLVGFLGLPYYSERSDFNEDIAQFIGTLLNVYFLLLIIAFIAALATANSITRPLFQLRDKLRTIQVGKKNEALKWETKDEIGDLIDEYNKMLVELERSASKLASSEREGAWREMAKQVAHEIKNPLTPMKLSIQYLNHAYQSRPEAIGPMLKRVSGTLIEQIDGLARIATEFSNFAKIPQAQNEYININRLVENVYNLFSQNDDVDMQLEIPEDDYTIFADKEQVLRVLNNIVKNAIQAIPDDRRGEINVSLAEEFGDSVVIRVKDNGCGIPEDKKHSVFVPNFTTKNSGTGLGLAISRKIVEHAGGTITFESVEDIGTTFTVRLPLKTKEEEYEYEPVEYDLE